MKFRDEREATVRSPCPFDKLIAKLDYEGIILAIHMTGSATGTTAFVPYDVSSTPDIIPVTHV